MGHSDGCLEVWYFLSSNNPNIGIDQTWKNKYIRSFISVSGPLSGTVAALFAGMRGMFAAAGSSRQQAAAGI